MKSELLSLHISQLLSSFERSKTNVYADSRKKEYHEQLTLLINRIERSDLKAKTYDESLILKEVVNFCFLSIEFLDNSTLVNIPHEIVFCLEEALKDWLNSDKYIIVTSLQNNLNSFSFNPFLALHEPFYDLLKGDFGIEFNYRLIQINLPKYLSHDYLANVVLYHELGHFIDSRFQITHRLQRALGITEEILNHYSEFFADVFAAQYIGNASNFYLDYIAHKAPDSPTHPSTDSRIKIVNEFLNNNLGNIPLENLKIATEKITSNILKKRSQLLSEDDFLNFIPTEVSSSEELHSLFEIGWNLWTKDVDEFSSRNIDNLGKYRITNNLIEKSISNYMVTSQYNNVFNKE
ncbi:MAG: hypothetical protein ACOC4J_06145 [Bacteroidota bacterium]